jgi:sugar-specific transcriptional regulator TrmB
MTEDRHTTGTARAGTASVREELRLFGFSDAEVETYLGILSRGEATARAVATDTGVSQRAVYDIVERLEQRGLVRVKDHASPTTIRALPPDEAIGALSARLESVAPALEERFSDTRPQAPEMRMVKSRETAIDRLETALAESEREALVALPEAVLPEVRAELRDAVDRGVLVFLLLGDTGRTESRDPEQYAGLAGAVRFWDTDVPFLYAVDQERAMIGSADLVAPTPSDEAAVAVSQEHLTGSVLGLYLSAYWPASTEVYVADPEPLPRTFDWFRRCVFCAARHRRAGRSLRAAVETECGASVAGPVTAVRQSFVEPPTSDFSLETSLVLSTDDGSVSVGGIGSFIEDYEAASVALRAAE